MSEKKISKTAENEHFSGESWLIIGMVLLGWSCYSLADVAIKLLANEGYSVWQVITIGAFFSSILLGGWVFKDRGLQGFVPKKIGWTVLRCIVVAILAISITHAFALVPLADVYGITFSAPFLTLILVFLLLKEPVGWPRWIAVAFGFAGVLILAGPKFADMNWGYLLAFNAMIFISLSTIILRKVGKDDHPALYGLYPIMIVFFVTLPLTMQDFIAPDLGDYWKFALQFLGVCGGQVFVSFATASAKETAAIAPFVYIQIIWGVLFGYFVFGDALGPANMLGLPLIIGAGLFMIYRERQLKKP